MTFWVALGFALFCLVMVVLTIDEEGPKDWYGNPIEEDDDDGDDD